MGLLLVVVGLGAALALGLWGSPRHLVRPPVRAPGLGLAALVAAVVADLVELPGTTTGRLVAGALAVAFLAANLALRGAAVAALAIGVGMAATVAHGAVVVPARTVAAIGSPADLGPARRVEEPDDRWKALSAAIPIPVLDRAVSFPDVVAATALVDVALSVVLVPRRRRGARGARARSRAVHPSARAATRGLRLSYDLAGAHPGAPVDLSAVGAPGHLVVPAPAATDERDRAVPVA